MTDSNTQRVWFTTGSEAGYVREGSRGTLAAGWKQQLDPWESPPIGAGFPEGE